MNLRSGIKILGNDEIDLVDRILMNSGMLRIFGEHTNGDGYPYSNNAFIPKDDWVQPSKVAYEILVASSWIDFCSTIAIVSIPYEAFQGLEKLEINSLQDKDQVYSITRQHQYVNAMKELGSYLNKFLISTDNLEVHALASNPAGLKTVTFDTKNNCYIGLHLDSWDKAVLSHRSKSRNRLCINLGRNDRYLLFVNLTLSSMLQMLDNTENEMANKYELRPNKVIEDFVAQYPDYPVIKLTIKPYEAYIAPTENMIHDGCTLGKSDLDIHLTLRGYFQVV